MRATPNNAIFDRRRTKLMASIIREHRQRAINSPRLALGPICARIPDICDNTVGRPFHRLPSGPLALACGKATSQGMGGVRLSGRRGSRHAFDMRRGANDDAERTDRARGPKEAAGDRMAAASGVYWRWGCCRGSKISSRRRAGAPTFALPMAIGRESSLLRRKKSRSARPMRCGPASAPQGPF
jgi:hypothetical protein